MTGDASWVRAAGCGDLAEGEVLGGEGAVRKIAL